MSLAYTRLMDRIRAFEALSIEDRDRMIYDYYRDRWPWDDTEQRTRLTKWIDSTIERIGIVRFVQSDPCRFLFTPDKRW